MASEWTEIDGLIHHLGAIRRAARRLRASAVVDDAVQAAIAEAASTIDSAIDAPRSLNRLMLARDALATAAEMIRVVDADIGDSLAVRARAAFLRERDVDRIRQADEMAVRKR